VGAGEGLGGGEEVTDVAKFTSNQLGKDYTKVLQWLADHHDGMLLFPDYPLFISQTILFERPVWLQGRNANSALYMTNPSGHTLLFASNGAVRIADLVVGAVVDRDIGAAGILITGQGQAGTNGFSTLERVVVHDHSILVSMYNAGGWRIRDSYLVNASNVALQIYNPLTPDSGDSLVEGTTFDTTHPGTTAILWHTGGGLRVTNNKILSHAYGFMLSFTDEGSTGDLIFADNSVENQTESCLWFVNSGSKTFANVQIQSNQMISFGPQLIRVETPGGWLFDLDISGNILTAVPGASQIIFLGGRDAFVHGNTFAGSTVAPVVIGQGASDIVVSGNKGPNGLI
jgi:hypothetical protein